MKKSIVVLSILAISSLHFSGCTTTFGRYDPEEKHALRTLTGGVLGGLIAGSTGGAILGAMAVDIFTVATVKYDDKKLYDRDEARKRYDDELQAEKLRDADKKAEELQERDRKAEQPRDADRKAEKLRDGDKRAEKKERDERVKLFIEKSSIGATNVHTGSTVKANVQYTLFASSDTRDITITETRILSNRARTIELGKREIVREQGTYSSTITFPVPEEMPSGYCILYTTISDGKYSRTTTSVLNII
jgi:hypothetical protein